MTINKRAGAARRIMELVKNIFLGVYKDGWTGGIQISVEMDNLDGYRIAGPKFNGSSTMLVRAKLTKDDAQQIRIFLDAAFPELRT